MATFVCHTIYEPPKLKHIVNALVLGCLSLLETLSINQAKVSVQKTKCNIHLFAQLTHSMPRPRPYTTIWQKSFNRLCSIFVECRPNTTTSKFNGIIIMSFQLCHTHTTIYDTKYELLSTSSHQQQQQTLCQYKKRRRKLSLLLRIIFIFRQHS